MINLAQNGLSHEKIIQLLQSDWLGQLGYRVDIVRDNSKVKELEVESCSITYNSESEVKYGAKLSVNQIEIDQNQDKIQPVMYIKDGKMFEFRFVSLLPASIQPSYKKGAKILSIECLDSTFILQQSSLGSPIYIAKGATYTNEIDKLVRSVGFSFTSITPNNKTVAHDRESWNMSDKVLKAVNELAREINYHDLIIGIDGVPTMVPFKEPSINNAKISYVADRNSVVYEEKTVEFDRWGKANIFVASVFTKDMTEPITAVFENNNPSDPTSTVNNPFKIVHVFKDIKDTADYASLYGEVRKRALAMSNSYETATLKTTVMPHHEAYETIAVSTEGVTGVWEETGWNIDNFTGGGVMSHKLRRVYY